MARIVIDARIIDSSTGVYVQRLIHFLHELPLYDYQVLVPSKSLEKWQTKYPNFTFHAADQPSYSFAEQFSFLKLINSLHPDLVHYTMPQQPLLWKGTDITTIHDTTLLRFENIDINSAVYKVKKAIFTLLFNTVLRRSRRILTPTEYVRDDLLRYSKTLPPERVIVTLEAGDPIDAEPEEIEALKGQEYLCFVGNAFPYKNIGRIIDAFAEIKVSHPKLHLALAGKKDFFYEQLEAGVKERGIKDVHFLGFISDGEKRWLYQNAVAMVTASLSEGFCIPLLEAMYEGCPVLASNASCIPEVAGNAALYFDPHSTEDLANKIRQLLNSPSLPDILRDKGHDRVKEFSWRRMAEQTHAAYTEVIEAR